MLRQNDGPAHEVLRIGAFRLLPAQRLLTKDDEAVKLGSRAFDILLALAEKPGEIVSQRELIAKVWPDVFVEDVSLRVHIASLRKVLERDGTRCLVNSPGRGYCLVAPVSRSVEAAGRIAAIVPAYPLPPPPARMVGRTEEVRTICEELLSSRLVSVVGPGGVGKTTAALSAAHALLEEFRGEVCFVELGPVGSSQSLAATIASAFRLPVEAQDPIPKLAAHLRDKNALLVLDSCEHLIAHVAAVVKRLCDEASDLRILATSREALNTDGEHVFLLPPLASPPEDQRLTAAEALAYPAVQLFVNRIAGAGGRTTLGNDDAHVVGDMCRQLGGIALAIELAAGRVATYGLRDTASLLNSQFALLWPGRRTAPPRQQTLKATLDWSYNLLSDAERVVLRRLSIFAGSFTLEAARQVAHGEVGEDQVAEVVASLLAKFLASVDLSRPVVRHRLLDTTRAYAGGKLEDAGEREVLRQRHAHYYRELLRATSAKEISSDEVAASGMDLDDVRAALRWAFDDGGDMLVGADIAAYSAPLWLGKGLLAEGREWMAKAAAASRGTEGVPIQQQLRIQNAFATTELFTSGFTKETVSGWAVTLERANSDGDAFAQHLSHLALWAGEVRAARYADALATAERFAASVAGSPDAGSRAMAEWLLGHSKHHVARFDETRDHLRRYLETDTEAARSAATKVTGYDRRVDALSVLSNTLWILGRPDAAKIWSDLAVAEAESVGFAIPVGLAMLWDLLNTYLWEPDVDVIERDAVELLDRSRVHSIHSDAGFALCVMGLCQGRRGRFGEGVRLVAEGLRVLSDAQMEAFSALVLAHVCEAALAAGRLNDALFWMSELERIDHNQDHWCSAEILRIRGLLADAQGDRTAALQHLSNAIALARRQGALSWELRSTMSLAGLGQNGAEARDALEAVHGRFEEGFGSADLLQAKRLIEKLRGRP
jgi:predicted ATPase/DNA-binding winged helix-turn-helix (wHTH) protein